MSALMVVLVRMMHVMSVLLAQFVWTPALGVNSASPVTVEPVTWKINLAAKLTQLETTALPIVQVLGLQTVMTVMQGMVISPALEV